MKRARTDSLTGGTGDVNPQVMKVVLKQPSIGASVATSVTLPFSRLPTSRGKAMVMEVLHIRRWTDINPDLDNAIGINECYVHGMVSTAPLTDASPFDPSLPSVIDFHEYHVSTIWGGTGNLAVSWPALPEDHDLTDGAGHGIIVATDRLYFWMDTNKWATAGSTVWDIRYRFKEVKLEEYIGVVQSQQT